MTAMTPPGPPRIPLWIDLRHVPRNKRLGYLGAARAAETQGILLETGDEHLGRAEVNAVAVDARGVLRRGRKRIGRFLQVHDAASQRQAGKAAGLVIASAADWRVIPLENLVAARRDRPGTLFAHAATPQEALLFARVLETGVHGVVLAPGNPRDIAETDRLLRAQAAAWTPRPPEGASATAPASPSPTLVETTVLGVEDAGMGDRVCVDCTAAFAPGEGLLIGSTARSFVLVLAETAGSPMIPARPFRVNAGALHGYALGAGNRTAYLSELAAGSKALAVSKTTARGMTVGRAKVEPRPHLLVRWSEGSVVLQNAETVCVLTPQGPRPVTALRPGDTLLVHHQAAGRHTGLPVEGRVEER